MSTSNVPATRAQTIEAVILRVLDGEPMREVAKELCGSARTLFDWLSSDRELAQRFARAMEMRADLLADEIVAIADGNDDPNKARNRISARQWVASKLLPKKYGERIDLNVNQTISIDGALTEARQRLRPVHDQQDVEDVQVIEPKAIVDAGVSDERSKTPDADEPDIFS